MDYDPRTEPHNLAHSPITSLVVPRPIGWISTINPSGVVNLAPYSFFNLIAGNPPFVLFSSNAPKHSQTNAETSGEFVYNMATFDLREQMNISGGEHAADVSEPELAGLEMVPSRMVKPPRVALAPDRAGMSLHQDHRMARHQRQALLVDGGDRRGREHPYRRRADRRRDD